MSARSQIRDNQWQPFGRKQRQWKGKIQAEATAAFSEFSRKQRQWKRRCCPTAQMSSLQLMRSAFRHLSILRPIARIKYFCASGYALILLLLPFTASAQVQLSGNAYIATFPIFQHYPPLLRNLLHLKENLLFDLTRFRLRPTLRLWRGARIRLEYELNTVISPDTIPLDPFYDAPFPGQLVDWRWLPIDKVRFKFFHFIDRLFFQQRLPQWRITIGRQRISWGAGRVWRLMDLFNPINPVRFDKLEREGIDALTLHFFPSPLSTIAAVYNPEQQGQHHNLALYGQSTWSDYDIALLIARIRQQWKGAAMLTGNLGSAAFRIEAFWNLHTQRLQLVAGIDHQLTPSLYAVFELLANHIPEQSNSPLLFGEIFSTEFYRGSWYSALLLHHQLTPNAQWLLLHMHNWSDGSGILSGEFRYSVSDETEIRGGAQFPYGKDLTEFGLLPWSLFLRYTTFFALPTASLP